MKLTVSLTALLLMAGTTVTSSAETPQWPKLPASGFITGRPATQRDVADGSAVFSTEKNGKVIRNPLPIQIPQYALWDDGKGHEVPVIVVQAEAADGMEIVGFRDAKGADLVGTRPELILLGQNHP